MNQQNIIINQLIRETLNKLWQRDTQHHWWYKHNPADFIDELNEYKQPKRGYQK